MKEKFRNNTKRHLKHNTQSVFQLALVFFFHNKKIAKKKQIYNTSPTAIYCCNKMKKKTEKPFRVLLYNFYKYPAQIFQIVPQKSTNKLWNEGRHVWHSAILVIVRLYYCRAK